MVIGREIQLFIVVRRHAHFGEGCEVRGGQWKKRRTGNTWLVRSEN